MQTNIAYSGPLTCSKCGSTNAVKPLNEQDVAAKCADCGHTKLTQEAEQRQFERDNPGWRDKFQSLSSKVGDGPPKF